MIGDRLPALIARTRGRIVDYFVNAGATKPDAALPYAPKGRLETRLFRRMVDFGLLVEVKQGRFWLDQSRLSDFRKESLARVLGGIALAGFAAAGAMAIGG
ncbi:hypothetical protein [Sphingomonas sp. Mn802worker]|uniref:hypothetical protein n=1 Tax=Sphingomonas sp. Mn802worker TaxID=629773 RepID=UPI00037E0C2E|nr:hypothetical protein [Sphingomonas sp. Mn802worker]